MPNYISKFVLNGVEYLLKAAASVTGVKGDNESSYRSGDVNITKDNIGLGNVGNYKAVSTVASQGLSDTEKSNARANIGAGTSSSDTKNTAGSTDTSSKLFLIGATSQAANPQTYSHDTAYVGTDGCLYSGGSKVLTAHDGNNRKAFYGTCATAAATKDKVVTLSESAGWPGLVAGVIVGVKFSNTNTYSNATSSPITLNVNNTGAKNIWYGSNHSGGGNTGANTTAYGRANYINYYMYDGMYWVWMSSSTDNNTTYSVATQSANGLLSSTDKKKLDTLSSVPTGQYHLTFGKST